MEKLTVNVRDAELARILCTHIRSGVVALIDKNRIVDVDVSKILEGYIASVIAVISYTFFLPDSIKGRLTHIQNLLQR